MNRQTAKTRTIVFVEDNSVVLAAYRQRLEREGFRVEPAVDGLEAMKVLSRLVPDLVVLDLLLPKFNGTEVLKFIYSQPRLKSVPVFILSTNSIVSATEEPLLEQANRRLLKDACTPSVMVKAVQELFAICPTSSDDLSSPAKGFQPATARTVVFVEDDPVMLAVYRDRLQSAGFHVQPAPDGLEAMKMLSRLVPDVVILDLLLPKFNGVDVLKYIQSNPHLKRVPVIVLSANSIVDAADEFVLERADKRLIKGSCTPAILLQSLQQLLAGNSAADQTDSAEAAGSKTGVFADAHVAA